MPDPDDRTTAILSGRNSAVVSVRRGLDYTGDGRSLLLCFARDGATLSMWSSPQEVEALARVLLAQATAARADLLEAAA